MEIRTISLTAIVLLILFLNGFRPQVGRSETAEPWFTDAQMTRLYESLVAFHQSGIFAPDRLQADTEVLTAYLGRHDPYARLYSASEYAAFRQSLSPEYGGVEMEISLTPDNTIICSPHPGGTAALAGIREGDRLLAVDGRNQDITDLLLTGSAIRGPTGATVQLTVRGIEGEVRTIVITRTLTKTQTAIGRQLGDYPTIRLRRFTAETPTELKGLLATSPPKKPLILDLRGNTGGNLEGAISAASLFLPAGREIVTLITTKKTTVRRSAGSTLPVFTTVVVLQDQQTASSAEVFTAALVQNRAAVSLGKQSYGKGVAQDFVRLTDGSALLVSFAKLLPPNKVAYHQRGLLPTVPIKAEHGDDLAYVRELKNVLHRHSP